MAGCNPLPSADNEYITLDAARRMLHISKRKCAALLRNGTIPCIVSGKKTRQYRILRDDVISLIKSPEKKIAADHSGNAIPYISPTAPERFREWLEDYWSDIPDVLTQADVISITGYCQSAVSAWMVSGKLESVNAYGVPIMSKEWLIDFMCVEGMKIRRKSDKHTEIMESFLRDNL